MSVNIMDLVKGAVSDQVMGQIGGLLGTDAKKTPSLFETAAGSILGGMMKKGSTCLLYTSPSPRDQRGSRMPSSA